MDRQIEAPVAKSSAVTSRNTNITHITNSAIVTSKEEELLKQMVSKINELYVRFDTNPDYYQKEDYKKLLDVLMGGFKYLYGKISPEIVTEWESDPSDEKIPSEKLVKDSLDSIDVDLSTKEDVSNKVIAFQETPDNTHYPSEKLVKDNLNELLGLIAICL